MKVWSIVVAAGSGRRFGATKQFELVGERRLVDVACDVAARATDGVVVVLPDDVEIGDWPADSGAIAVVGGATRSASVRAGLAAVPADADVVCVHDAARPLASAELFHRVVAAVAGGADGAVPCLSISDTIKQVDADGVVVGTPERSSLVAVQTPQAFRFEVLRRAHAGGGEGTDDAALVERLGGRVVTVAGEANNRKVTDRDDLEWVRSRSAAGVQ